MGANPYTPTDTSRRWVKAHYSMGATQPEIAQALGIDEKTLRKCFREELDQGLLETNHAVAGALYEKATIDKDTSAIIWWEKTRAGKSDKVAVDNRFPDGHPMENLNFSVIKPKADE